MEASGGVSALYDIVLSQDAKKSWKKASSVKAWDDGSPVDHNLKEFVAKLVWEEHRTPLQNLSKKIEVMLGAGATMGTYNVARLYRFLRIAKLDEHDAKVMIAASAEARVKHGMDGKRAKIVTGDLSFATLPWAADLQKLWPATRV